MSHTITIPDTLYAKAQRIAGLKSISVDDVIQDLLSHSLDNPRLLLPAEEQDELTALSYLSDATLKTIAREQMPQSQQDRMQILMDKNNQSSLTGDEHSELSNLVEDGQRLMLRKAEALKILIQRGHQINLDSMTSND